MPQIFSQRLRVAVTATVTRPRRHESGTAVCRTEVVNLLPEHGADVNAKNR
jgi:hypothetical protein